MRSSEAGQLLEDVVYSASHDLRGPLVTMSLAADLLEEVLGNAGDGRVGPPLVMLRQGAREVARMLDALVTLSAAFRHSSSPHPTRASDLLAGHLAISDDLSNVRVHIDAAPIRALLDRLLPPQAHDVHAELAGQTLTLRFKPAEALPPVRGRPLAALLSSLAAFAGTAVEQLAALEAHLERVGGGVAMEDGEVVLVLPIHPTRRAVLIVDDEQSHALIAQAVLRMLAPDAAVDIVTEPSVALGAILAAPPGALILIDRRLGGADAVAAIRKSRAHRPDLAFAVLSSALDERDRERARAAGAIAAEQKPAALAEWRSLIARLLDCSASLPTP